MTVAWRRTFVAAAGALLLAVSTIGIAEAHGGPLIYSGEAGPYRVDCYRSFIKADGQQVLLYRMHLRDRGTGQRVDGADVAVELRRGEVVLGPLEAPVVADDYEVRLPVEFTDDWLVTVSVIGPFGETVLVHKVPPPAPWLEPIIAYGVPLSVIGIAWFAKRRRAEKARTSVLQ